MPSFQRGEPSAGGFDSLTFHAPCGKDCSTAMMERMHGKYLTV